MQEGGIRYEERTCTPREEQALPILNDEIVNVLLFLRQRWKRQSCNASSTAKPEEEKNQH